MSATSTTITNRYVIEAEVMPKQGVNDPQGDSILSGLRALGFSETGRVRCGKLIRLEVDADSEEDALARATVMCEKLLANPVIEEFEVRAIPSAQAGA
ncbi:MAG: phosphoribosylformylglycinamidine synthase subunit PurS [Thermomicrobiales bacterium]